MTIVNEYLFVPPNWGDPVIYKRRWQTGMQIALDGTEKRSALFTWPRRSLSYSILIDDYSQAAYLKRKLHKNIHNVWGVPFWQDKTYLTSQAASGQKILNVLSTQYRNFEVGAPCVLRALENSYEVGTIQSFTSSQIILQNNLVNSWPTRTEVYPILKCRIKSDQSIDMLTSIALEARIEAVEEYDDGITRHIGTIGPELVTNGGMEDGDPPTGWNTISSPETFERSNVRSHRGSYSAHLVDSVPSNGGFYQQIPLTVGKSYKLSFWYYLVSGTMSYVVFDGGESTRGVYTTLGSWHYSEVIFTSLGGAASYLAFQGLYSAAEFYIDDVSLQEADGFPLYKGSHIFNFEPNWGKVNQTFVHPYDLLSYFGKSSFLSHYSETEFGLKMDHVVLRKSDIQKYLDFFDAQMGRWGNFWVSSWQGDIKVTQPFGITDTHLAIQSMEFPTYWLNTNAGGNIILLLPDNSYACVGVIDATTLLLTLDGQIGVACSLAQLRRLLSSFLYFARFDQDEIEIQYQTDAIGETSLSFRTLFTGSSLSQLTVAPAPSGPLGSKTNPYKMDKPTLEVWGGYIAENENSNAEVSILAGEKVYFEVDPGGLSFKFFVGFYSGAGTICKLTQNKVTGVYSAETCQGSDSYFDIVTNPPTNKKFLYAIDNSGSPGSAIDKLWVIVPFNP